MKKLLVIAGLVLAANAAFAQAHAPMGNKNHPLTATVPTTEAPDGSFTFVLVPDPQSYNKFAANQPLFALQTAWIADNIDRLRIKAALFAGDMVEQNNKLTFDGVPHPLNGNQTSRQQWQAASDALKYLDHRLPYVVTQGNHDAGFVASESRISLLPEYIYPERNIQFEGCLVATCPNWEGVNTLENAAYEFSHPNWGNLLVVSTEFAPRDEVLDWIRTLISSDRFKNHRVIYFTHGFLNSKGKMIDSQRYTLEPRNWPNAVWEKLIHSSDNIDLVLCGHSGHIVTMPEDARNIEDVDYSLQSSLLIEKAHDGRDVTMMMFNSQTADGQWFGNGGDCWIRLLEFMPDGQTINVRTFSPLFAQSPLTRHLAWRNAPTDKFTITLPKRK